MSLSTPYPLTRHDSNLRIHTSDRRLGLEIEEVELSHSLFQHRLEVEAT